MERFQKLANGSTVIAWKGTCVLCHWTGMHGEKDEFVTWRVATYNDAPDSHLGRYFPGTPTGLAMAVDDLIGRG